MSLDINLDRYKIIKPINIVLNEAIKMIEARRNGEQFGFRTGWEIFDKTMGGGIPYNTTTTIAARPSVGKSAFATAMIFEILKQAKQIDEKVIALYWTFEMPAYQQALRYFSKEINKTVNEIIAGNLIDESSLSFIEEAAERVKDYNLYFIDVPQSSRGMYETVCALERDYPEHRIINIFDHTRLIIKNTEKTEEEKIFNLLSMCNILNKAPHRCTNIILSQLNRKVVDDMNKTGYRAPDSGDIFGADAVAQYSNIVITLHRPEMHGVTEYSAGATILGVKVTQATKNKLYVEVVKNRDGEIGTIVFDHDIARNLITEKTKTLL